MRDIKFRGKTTDEVGDRKIWIYGDLLQGCEILNIYEISDCESIDGTRYQVEPNSIGQYTGIRDKNGKEIYEGDIFTLGDEIILYIVEWIDTAFRGRQNGNKSAVGLMYWNDRIEVIGNIYENPELLEESEIKC